MHMLIDIVLRRVVLHTLEDYVKWTVPRTTYGNHRVNGTTVGSTLPWYRLLYGWDRFTTHEMQVPFACFWKKCRLYIDGWSATGGAARDAHVRVVGAGRGGRGGAGLVAAPGRPALAAGWRWSCC